MMALLKQHRSIPWAALALACTAFNTQAQSTSNGQTLYNQVIVTGQNSCAASACHGSNPSRGLNKIKLGISASTIKNGINGVGQMQFLAGHLSDAELNDLAAYIASVAGGTPSYLTVSAAPLATLSATSVAFGSVTVGNTSPTRAITLTNGGSAALSINTLSSNHSAYTLSHNCPISPATLAVASACTLSLSFTPPAASAYNSSVSVSTNAASGTQSISLSGAGAAAAVALLSWSGSPSALSFAATTVGSSSAVQTLTLLNQGSTAATLSAITLGGTDAADFLLGGTCAAATSLAANGSCTVTVAFQPSATGSRSATLQVSAANASNPGSLSLSGTATAASSGSTAGTGSTSAGTTSNTATSNSNSNEGGGGCSLARPGAGFDPVLGLLSALAAAVLWWRRREAKHSPRH